MTGRILGNGVIKGDDGKRYSFTLDEVKNLKKFFSDENEPDLDNFEVDFEVEGENKAIEVFITSKQGFASQPSDNSQKIESFCEEINCGVESKFKIFRGRVEGLSSASISHSFGQIQGNARRISGALGSLVQKDKSFKMGDKTFVFELNGIAKFAPLLSISGINPMVSSLGTMSGSSNINLEDNDEVVVAAVKGQDSGLYQVEALKNLSKDYYFSHIRHSAPYLFFGTMFLAIFMFFFMIGLFMSFDGEPGLLLMCIFVWLPLFLVGRFFALRIFGVNKRKKIDKFLKNFNASSSL